MTEIYNKYNNQYRKYVNFIKKYRTASNAASGSEVDANANVEVKNVATMTEELCKREKIGCNRLLMLDKLNELYGEEYGDKYINQLENHLIYRHDETHPNYPYCVSITMYPFLFDGLKTMGGLSTAPTNLDSFCGSFVNLVFAIASQFAGAVSTPEMLMYMDWFIRKEYGDEYYKNPDAIVTSVLAKKQKTINNVIHDKFQQIVYSINQPAAARGYQAVFWNIAYFDHPYFNGMFENFVFPDGTVPQWESLDYLQRNFMKWLNNERLKEVITFPVETLNLLNDGKDAVDKDYADFQAEMYSEGHSFFTYTSNSVDSLASCCFDGKQTCLTKSFNEVNLMSFEDLYNSKYCDLDIFYNGKWAKGKIVRLPKRDMYKITTSNNKELYVTDNHIFPTLNGDKKVSELNNEDLLMVNSKKLSGVTNEELTYAQGKLIGMYLKYGSMKYDSIYDKDSVPIIYLLVNKKDYDYFKTIINNIDANDDYKFTHIDDERGNVYKITIKSSIIKNLIKKYVKLNSYGEEELNMNCLLESCSFREGIIEGCCANFNTNFNTNFIYANKSLAPQIECLLTSLGLISTIETFDTIGNKNTNTACRIEWYKSQCENEEYCKIDSIEKYDYDDEYVYCFEMENKNEPYFTLPNGIISHNCRLRNEMQDNTFSYTLGAGGVSTGSKAVITMNINRIVQNVYRNKDVPTNEDISNAISQQAEDIHKYLIAYNEIIKDNFKSGLLTAYNAGYISLEKQYLTIGINGFVEAAEFLGIDISPNEKYFNFGKTILKPIYDINKRDKTSEIMFNTEYVPAENLGVKNAKWDKQDGYVVPRDCYNSYFYKSEDETCNIIDKFILHGQELTKYLDGGSALHANLDEHLTKKQYRELLRIAIKTGCSYYTFNIPNTICNDCGYISKHRLSKCEKCGSENLDYITRIIGYLKRVSRFSEPRQTEENKRYYTLEDEVKVNE